MIIAILGGIGSGKSVSAVKRIVDYNCNCMVNFNVKSDNVIRLRKEHIIKEDAINGKKIDKQNIVNWDFWNMALNKYGNYHIFLDEVHNIIHSRRSMSGWNIAMSMWISQIRKLLGSSEKTHIFLVSQRLQRIDSAFRDLVNVIIHCQKFETGLKIKTELINNGKRIYVDLPETYIIQHYFNGEGCIDDYSTWLYGGRYVKHLKTSFLANPYFKFYDTHQIFGETAYL